MPCDYKLYPADWKEIRQRILKRAGYVCEHCRLPNYAVYRWDENGRWQCIGGNLPLDTMEYTASYAEAKDVRDMANEDEEDGKVWRVCVLTIAHLDHNTQNNDPANLRAYCNRCHLRHDGRFHAQNARRTRDAKKAVGSLFADGV